MNTQYRKNLKAVAQACKDYTDESIANLEWQIGTYNYDVATDSNVARIKTLPSDTYKSQVDYIGGKSVKYNQLVQNGNFDDNTVWTVNNATFSVSNNVASFIATARYGGIKQTISNCLNGHKYLYIFNIKTSSQTTDVMTDLNLQGTHQYVSVSASTSWQTLNAIVSMPSDGNITISIQDNRISDWDNIDVDFVELIDLTDIFGAGNEPSTVATAIPLLKANGYKLDGTDEYSTGSLKHAITTSVNFLPINVWDEETRNGYYGTNGIFNSDNSYIANKNPIKVVSNQDYYWYGPNATLGRYCWYDKDMNFISTGTCFNPQVITSPSNASFLNFDMKSAYGTTYKNDICINISNASYNGNYYPYVAPITKAIPSQVLADNRYGLGYDNTNYNHLDSDGHLRGSWGIVDLGSLNYGLYNQTYGAFYSENLVNIIKENSNILIIGFTKEPSLWYMNHESTTQKGICVYSNGYIYIRDNVNWLDKTPAQVKEALSGVYLVYELATAFDQDYSQYFTPNWNKVDLDNQYATCEMVVAEPIDMPNSITNLIKEVKA